MFEIGCILAFFIDFRFYKWCARKRGKGDDKLAGFIKNTRAAIWNTKLALSQAIPQGLTVVQREVIVFIMIASTLRFLMLNCKLKNLKPFSRLRLILKRQVEIELVCPI